MPFLNQDNRHFTEEEKVSVQKALTKLQTTLATKLANLTTYERKQFGSVNEQNKLIINKVKDYQKKQPNLASPDINWQEYLSDYDSRLFLQTSIKQLAELVRGMQNAKILHDWDNYQAALIDYNYTQYKNNSGANGYGTKLTELKQFLSRTGTSNPKLDDKDVNNKE